MAKKSSKNAKTIQVYRDSKSGQFLSVDKAGRARSKVIKERIPIRDQISPKSAKVIEKTDKKYGRALDRLAKR